MARDQKSAPTRKELAWKFLKQGMSVEWLSMRFGFPVEDLRKAKLEHERREEARRDK
jgi:hypothetical protein